MRLIVVRAVFLIGCLIACRRTTYSQITATDPAQPRWGQKLTIIYDTAAAGAKFTTNDEVYVALRLSFPGYGENASARMTKTGKLFKAEFPVKENLSRIAAHFIAPGGGSNDGDWDEAAYTTAMIYRADGKPARGAYAGKINARRYRELFEQEIALYPDNYSAYRSKWGTAALIESDGAAGLIKNDVTKLGRASGETAELLSALSFGRLMLGSEEKSLELIRKLVGKYPDDLYTALAISDYERLVVERNLPGAGIGEISKLKREIIKRNPQTEFARNAAIAMAEDQKAPLDLIETICGRWMEAEPENPQPWFTLALAYQNQYQKPERAAQLIEKAIEFLRGGKLRLFGDINGRQSRRMAYLAHVIKGEIASRQSKNDVALTAVAVAETLASKTDWQAHLLEARIWRSMGKEDRAEAAFIEAWRRGSQEAEDRLKAFYKEKRGNLQGYDEYLLGKGRGENNSGSSFKLPAPEYRGVSLDGKTFDSKSLQGKIVVVNLWFIACGPCRKEIPKLNEVVREFRGKDVVFIAPTPDKPEPLREFLKTLPFDYNIIPGADRIIEQFNAVHFPTHVVIDRNGQIESLMIGAGERRPEEVRRALLQILGR
ncbi:MAG TPA: redoxin domain-containing protein [Blastocatellia bacterium]|nr:redoxin domain-containing protein [Blastocatellia bacterium]